MSVVWTLDTRLRRRRVRPSGGARTHIRAQPPDGTTPILTKPGSEVLGVSIAPETDNSEQAGEPRLVILTNDDLKMSRGKRCAQAVHAALMALGVHPGCPVIVLGASAKEIEACPVQIRDAGLTELEPGTLTAGVREAPGELGAIQVFNGADHVLTAVADRDGFYTTLCSCGGYRSKPYRSPTTGLRHGLMHARAREVADADQEADDRP